MKRLWFAAFAVAGLVGCDELKVSDLGYDPEDSTRFIQKALDSGVKRIVLDKQAGPWYTLPLKMRSNTELILEDGVELVAKRGAFKDLKDYLLELPGVENCAIRGGKGATLRMWKKDYQGPDYKHGEWRYGLRLHYATNVVVEGISVVESGGDGLGVLGKNITVRNCVFDRNHRQGASIFDVDGLLMENCVFSNTKGTAPAAGIDFEPDRRNWQISNCVIRNCDFNDNAGSGILFYLGQLHSDSKPVSVRFENCRTRGNNEHSVDLGAGPQSGDNVGGLIEFVDCRFERAVMSGIKFVRKTKEAFRTTFSGCEVVEPKGAAIVFACPIDSDSCDCVDFGNMTVRLRKDGRLWNYEQVLGAQATDVTGTLNVIAADGTRKTEVIDAAWRAKNMPPANGGKPLPPMVRIPDAASVTAVDANPGEFVDLAPVTTVCDQRDYVFLAEKPGKVRFVGRQISVVAGRKVAMGKKMTIAPADGKGGKVTLPLPLEKSVEFSFEAKKRGFYVLSIPKNTGTRFYLEKSTAPVAIDVTKGCTTCAGYRYQPFSLWMWNRAGGKFATIFGGNWYFGFKVTAIDSAGKKADVRDNVSDSQIVEPSNAAGGLWRFDFERPTSVGHFDWIAVGARGVPGALFLSDRKYWK